MTDDALIALAALGEAMRGLVRTVDMVRALARAQTVTP
jgi:hypothetical protein